jgi:uncharacterized protein (DUF1778 family)
VSDKSKNNKGRVVLSGEDKIRFIETLLKPFLKNKAFKKAMKDFRDKYKK